MNEMLQTIIDMLPEGWEIDDEAYGMSFLFVCPHGDLVEQDGHCPEGLPSPMLTMGLI